MTDCKTEMLRQYRSIFFNGEQLLTFTYLNFLYNA